MDIGSGKNYPANSLSNFAGHRFIIDGITCNSMEGFLQSLKFKHIPMQEHTCTLIGKAAKFRGKGKKWWIKQELYWKGIPMKRDSKDYQELLDRAYIAMFEQSKSFRNALFYSGESTLKHSIGKTDSHKTILTIREFCNRLTNLRKYGTL